MWCGPDRTLAADRRVVSPERSRSDQGPLIFARTGNSSHAHETGDAAGMPFAANGVEVVAASAAEVQPRLA